MRRSLLFVMVLALGWSSLAQAQTPKVYVVDFPAFRGQATDLITEQITKVTRDRMDADPTVNLLPRLAMGGGGLNPALAEATRLYEVGRSNFVGQNFDEAIKNFEGSLAFLEGNLADVTDWSMVEEILFSLASSYFGAGKTDEATSMIRRLIAFRPEFEAPQTEDTPKELIALFDKTRKRQLKRQGKLDTSGVTAEGAEIWIDGSIRGATPMKIEDLVEGTHFVVLRKGDASLASLVTIEKKKTYKLRGELIEKPSPEDALTNILTSGQVGPDAARASRDIANATAASFVVSAVIVPMKDGYDVLPFVYNAEVATLRRLDPVPFDKDLLNVNVDGYTLSRDVIDAVYDPSMGVVVDDNTVCDASPEGVAELKGVSLSSGGGNDTIKIDPGDGNNGNGNNGDSGLITDRPVDTDEENWYENPWVWTGIAGGILAIAGGVVLALYLTDNLGGGGDTSGFNATIQW